MTEILKEYLVSVGWKADDAGFAKVKQMLSGAKKEMGAFKAIAGGTALVVTGLAAVNLGMAKYIGSLAKADLENQKLARSMWTTKDNAEAMQKSLDALGATMQDLWWSPELRAQFQQLRREALSLQPPEDYSQQMAQVREVSFEFSRMKMSLQYAGQWVAYYFLKYIEKPLQRAKEALREFNDQFQIDLPKSTQKVAQVLSWFFRLGAAGLKALLSLGGSLMDLWEAMPKELKIVGAAIGAAFGIASLGPIGLVAAALILLLGLLDDYQTWAAGGESLFDWSGMADAMEKIKAFAGESGILEKIAAIGENIGGIIENVKDAANQFDAWFQEMTGISVAQAAFQAFSSILQGIVDLVSWLIGGIETITGGIKSFLDALTGKKSWKELGSDLWGWMKETGKELAGKNYQAMQEKMTGAQNLLQIGGNIVGDRWERFSEAYTTARSAPSVQNSTQNRTTTNNITMNITGSNAQEIADEVDSRLSDPAFNDGSVRPAC